ncbi:MAG: CRTAC1 family protein [Rubripirellula sp.]
MNQHPDNSITDLYTQYHAQLTSKTPWQDPEQFVGAKTDLSGLTPFAWSTNAKSHQGSELAFVDPSTIRFADQAATWGLNHICAIKRSSDKEGGLAIYQTSAGGAGVIDFDLDGLPDLYLTASDGRPKERDSTTNRLYRNQLSQFRDVTGVANAADTSFSQGIGVGDYNSDGFPDLLVANIGQNRLLRNNGDGSFTDVSDSVGIVDEQWTTSVAMADIDGDGITDLFLAGYCAGEKPFSQPCFHEGEERACTPVAFEAQRDQVLQGKPDGTFADVTESWLGQHANGYGLAVVVGTLDGNPGLDIYVANDTIANHYWSVASEQPSKDAFRLTESATLRGLAFNIRSIAQASMGIAAGDADADGDVDLFLTHFTNDYHTFYQQIQSGIWADRTTPLGLASATDAMLGFGTQWVDTNNDGQLELLVGNGHIDDFPGEDGAFRMPTQLFYRSKNDAFLAADSETVGEFFRQRHLIRAVATLDVNVDGKLDAVATRIYDPVALLVNETATENRSVRICLKGTSCDRDAIGAQVQYTLAGKKRNDQLFAGDGFQCTNEKFVTLGVGAADQIEDVVIVWPDQSKTTVGTLPAGNRYLIVQGSDEAFQID